MEAPVKFTAPSLTLPVGLDVGRTVFSALNKVEISFALLMIIALYFYSNDKKTKVLFSFVLIILILQTIWLLPVLNERASIIINGGTPPESNIHVFYIILETLKLILLFLVGFFQVRYFRNFF